MFYKDFKNIKTSFLGMGNMRLPTQDGSWESPIDRAKAHEIIDYAMANGVNYYDTAYVYHNGESEKFLGKALTKYPRESYYLATKFFIMASKDYKAVFEEQLARLKTDYIDFYLIHGIFDTTHQEYIDGGAVEYFKEQKEKGRIKYLGFSSHANIDNLTSFANHHKWDFAQIQLNYFDWLYGNTKQQYEILEKLGIPIIAMSPARGGRLASLSPESEAILKEAQPDWSIASWAFRWLKKLPGVQVVLSGMSTLEQIKENTALFLNGEHLNDEQEKLLFKAYETSRSELIVPCTDCRYCCNDCPAQIDIPKILEIYNRYKIDGSWALNALKDAESKGKPADCTGCGACDERCPQSIKIKDIMKELEDGTK